MRPSDDHRSDMNLPRRRHALDVRVVEALLAGHPVPDEEALSGVVAALRRTVADVVLSPGAALAALLEDGVAPAPLGSGTRRPSVTWGARVAVALAAAGATLIGAATANALPTTVQTAIADAVDALTPFEMPRPSDDAEPDVDPTGTDIDTVVDAASDDAADGDDPPSRSDDAEADGLLDDDAEGGAQEPAEDSGDDDGTEPDNDDIGSPGATDSSEPDDSDGEIDPTDTSREPDGEPASGDDPDSDAPDDSERAEEPTPDRGDTGDGASTTESTHGIGDGDVVNGDA